MQVFVISLNQTAGFKRLQNMQRKQWTWIGLGVGALLLRQVLVFFPQIVEQYYSRGLFLGVRWSIDYLLAWFPAPLMYVFWALFLIWLVYQCRRLYRREATWQKKALSFFTGTLAFVGGILFFFLFLWGYNYIRVPIEDQLGIEATPLEIEALEKELELETQALIRLRPKLDIPYDAAFTRNQLPDRLESQVRQTLEHWLKNYGFPTTGRVRGRLLYPKGVFLRFSSLGLYFPFTGEGHIDAGIHPVQLPHVMAHEMSHGYGFGDEGTCNFLAYVSCTSSDDPAIAYAGHLSYWRTVAGNYRRANREGYKKFFETLPEGIKADLYAIRDNNEKYPDIMPKLRYQAYEAYLKAQGIQEGMKNYSRVLMLVRAWREANAL
jgi:hypothetical protein